MPENGFSTGSLGPYHITERFMEKYRLHEIEALLELFSTDPFVFRPAELYNIEGKLREKLENYNIYAVGIRPRISIHPESLTIDYNTQIISGVFSVNLGFEIKQIPFKYKNNLDFPITELGKLDYPFDHLRFVLNNHIPVQIRIHDVIRFSETNLSPYSNLKIEYIGQSYGDEGSSDAINRLIGKTGKQGHGSLQKVLADINASYPESEAYILLYSFEFYKKVTIGGAGPEPKIPYEETPDRFDDLLNATVPRPNRIDLVEAALIRYFQPKYNDIYKKTFPKVTHDILKTLFDLDITGLSTSLSTNEHNIMVYSDKVAASDLHLAMYPIVKDKDRASFLDLSMPASEIVA